MYLSLRLGNLRMRLALWYGTAFALLLTLHIGVATYVHYRQLMSQTFHAEIQDLETAEGLLYQTPDGRIEINQDYFNRPQLRLEMDRLLEILAPGGPVLYRGAKLNGVELDGALFPGEGVGTYNERTLRLADGRRVLAISHYHLLNGRPIILRVAYDEAPIFANVWRFLVILLGLAPISIAAAVFVVYRIAQRALLPLSTMVRRAEQITAERLNERLPVHDESDALGHTAQVFNELLQRLEDSFKQLKRFTSDASHELRTPLASLRSIGEVSLRKTHSNEEYRDVIASMLEEVRRLTRLVESLLAISRADSGQIALQLSAFSFIELIEEVTDVVGILAEDKQQVLRVEGDASILAYADRGILRQAILNLVDNAIKYSPEGSEIAIDVHPVTDGNVEITFTDQGPGVRLEEQALIFDRFYRADEGRSREKGGTGLGLSIAKWAVEIHKGSIGMDREYGEADQSNELGKVNQGSRFYVRLPVWDRTNPSNPEDHGTE